MHRSKLQVLGFRTLSPEAYKVITDRTESLDMGVSDYLRRLVSLDCTHRLIERYEGSEDALEELKV